MCFASQRRALFRYLNFQKRSERGVLCTFWLGNAPQGRALFQHRNFQKWSEPGVSCTFWLGNVLRATTAWTFSTSQLPKVLVCFVHFDLEMCFAPQGRALFQHHNFQKWSEPGVLCTFWLGNALRATTACNCSSFIWPTGSAPAALASLLFDPPERQIIGKTQCFATFLPFRAPGSSFFWDFLFFGLLSSSLLFSDSSPAFHLSISSEAWLLNFLRLMELVNYEARPSFLFHDMTGFNARSNNLSGNHTYAPKPLTNPNFLTTLLYPSPVPARHSHPTQWHKLLMFSSRPLCNGSCRGSSRPICKPSPWTDAQPSNVAWRRMRRQSEAEGPCWCGWISALGRVRKFLKRILVVRRIRFPQTWECSIVFHSHLRLGKPSSASDPQSDLAAGPSTRSSPVICCESSAKQDGWRRPISQNLCKVWNATPRSTSTCLHNNTSNRFLYIYTMWIYVIILFWYMQGTRTLGRVRIPCFRPMIAQALPNWQPGEGPSSNGSKGALASTWWLNMGHTSCSLASPCGPNEAMLPREFIPWLLMSCNDDFDFDLDAWSKSWSSA